MTLPAFLADELREHLLAYPPTADGRVFSTSTGSFADRVTLWRRFKNACISPGVPTRALHDLRHTCAALSIKGGAHPMAIKARLGHANISETLDTYGHLFPELDEDLAGTLDTMAREAQTSGQVIPFAAR